MSRYIPAKFAPKLYSDWYLLIKKLSPTKQAEVIRAIFEYPDFTPDGVDCWDFLSSRLDDQYQRFIKNREARTEAAKKGAESRWRKDDDSEIPNSPTDSKIESVVSIFAEFTDDEEIIATLNDTKSDLYKFLQTGNGSCYDAMSEKEKKFADLSSVREKTIWHRKINKPIPAKSKKKSADTSELFERFWANFPSQRKCDKAKCAIRFHNIVAGGISAELIIQKAADYAATDEVKRKFAAMPMTWLNQERWNLDFSAAAQQKKNDTGENPL